MITHEEPEVKLGSFRIRLRKMQLSYIEKE